MKTVPYLLIMLYPLLGYLNAEMQIKNKSFDKYFKVEYVWFVFLIFAALRGNGDGDYFNYLNGVKYINSFEKIFFVESYPFEIGFRLISYIVNFLKFPPQLAIATLNLISLYTINYIINKYSRNKWLSWFLYFPFLLMFDMHHSRNAVAMGFAMLYFFDLVIERNYKKSIFSAVLALSFHKSSVFSLLIVTGYYFVFPHMENKLTNNRVYSSALGISVLVRIFISPKVIVRYLKNNFSNVKIFFKLDSYLSSDRWSYPFRLYDPRFVLLLLMYLFSNLLVQFKAINFKHYLNMTLIALLTVILMSESTILAIRFYSYFNLFSILLVTELLDNNVLKIKYKQYLKIFVISSYTLYFIMLILQQAPYHLYFFT